MLIAVCAFELEGQSSAFQASASRQETNPPTVRSESTVVLVPTLVRTKSGDVVHGLSAADFIVDDDGVAQSVRIADSPDVEPLSLVVAVQVGRTAVLELGPSNDADGSKTSSSAEAPLSGLGDMLQAFAGEAKADVAVVAFDSGVRLVQNFSDDMPEVADKLDKLTPGDDGAAILDAVLYSVDLLDHRPTNGRRVLVLISETRDHGSRVAKIENVVQEVGLSNTVVYSLAFSPTRSQVMHDLHEQPQRGANANLLAPLMIGANSMRKNTASSVARLAGGEYATFTNARSFDGRLERFAGDDRDRYMLSFQLTNPKPGPHSISVRMRNRDAGYIVTARNMYWSVAKGG
ncbi:MAG TPA: VWA domain-containing protein [Candidatus Acidoferrales bacterium]